jgi:hypothetical protein
MVRLLPAILVATVAVGLAAPAGAVAPPGGPASTARPPLESGPLADVRALLPDAFKVHQTAHYVILSDAGRSFAQRQGEHLERAFHQFHRFCERLGVTPLPPRHKLVVVAFGDREAYRRFARLHDGVADAVLAGYYAPTSDRVVLYDVQSNPSVRQARTRLDEMRTDLRALDRQIRAAEVAGLPERAKALRGMKEQYEGHLGQQEQRVSAFMVQAAAATVIHEAVHQLMYHSGVQSPRVQYPIWVNEGLATSFETEHPHGSFGPDREYEPRRAEFRALRAAGRLMRLRDLVVLPQDADSSEQAINVIYHQSYALVTWMVRKKPEALRAYLDELRRGDSAAQGGAERWLAVFEKIFGDVDALERAWLEEESRAPRERIMP